MLYDVVIVLNVTINCHSRKNEFERFFEVLYTVYKLQVIKCVVRSINLHKNDAIHSKDKEISQE